MFYKRISDLQPLGKPKDGNWNNIIPIEFERGRGYSTSSNTTSYTYNSNTNDLSNREIGNIPFNDLKNYFNGTSGKRWYDTTTITKNNYKFVSGNFVDESDLLIDSEYYAKSLWFEVAVSKNSDNKPDSGHIDRYQSKRVNAFLLFQNINELHADCIDAPVISCSTLKCADISSTRITAQKINATSITANYGNISSISSTSITTQAISSDIAIINNLTGNMLYYNEGYFSDITVTGTAHLTAEAAYWADVAEIYTADKGYLYGTLVKFGGEKEITIADNKANAVISEKPAITLNAGNKEENALPIVLTGRSKVRTIHPVKKFNKIYLSEKPGVGSISSYKISSATMPIGIALEDKPGDEEGLVECILQLNFE